MADEFFRNSDRRREERIPARIEIHFSKAKDAAKAFKAYSLNFSPGGLCVRMKTEHALGDRLSIKLVVGGEEFDLEGVVSWARGTVTGMRFDGLSADDRGRLERVAEVLRNRPMVEVEEDVEI